MTTRTMVKMVLLSGLLTLPVSARAQSTLDGANSDFPDQTLVMPFAASGSRSTFFSISNCSGGTLTARWTFFDKSGEQIAQVYRDILNNCGTDVVDITSVRNRTF